MDYLMSVMRMVTGRKGKTAVSMRLSDFAVDYLDLWLYGLFPRVAALDRASSLKK